MCVQGIVEIFLSSVLMINTAGDLGQWKSEVSECSPWCCHPRGDHPLNGRVQDREGSSHLSRLHPRERPPAPGVRLLVPERADDQLRHGSRGHRHHHAGKEDELPAEHTKVRNWQKYSRKSVFFLCSAQPHHSGNYTCKPSSSIPASIQLFVLGQRPTNKIKKSTFYFQTTSRVRCTRTVVTGWVWCLAASWSSYRPSSSSTCPELPNHCQEHYP